MGEWGVFECNSANQQRAACRVATVTERGRLFFGQKTGAFGIRIEMDTDKIDDQLTGQGEHFLWLPFGCGSANQ